ncbi:MAG: hypothetical protein AAGI09_03485 [Pseudomonadota bacterium]
MAITDEESARAWLDTQSDRRIHIAFAARSALRGLPGIGVQSSWYLSLTVLPALRATLTSVVGASSKRRTAGTTLLIAAEHAKTAASFDSLETPAFQSMLSAANSVYSITPDPRSHKNPSARAANRSAKAMQQALNGLALAKDPRPSVAPKLDRDAFERAFSANEKDAFLLEKHGPARIFRFPIWHETQTKSFSEPEGIAQCYVKLTEFFDSDPAWSFWKRWLDGMRRGEPEPWKLQEQIALIGAEDEKPFAIWEGPDAPARIAEEIESIENAFAAQAPERPSFPEHEPESVAHILDFPTSANAAVTAAIDQITYGFEVFRSMSGLNETPELLKPLEAVPENLNVISQLLRSSEDTREREGKLREEIGRLRAKIAQLETELAKAKDDAELKSKPWLKKAAVLCCSVGALCSTVWMVSGDEIGPKQRSEKVMEYWEFIFGPILPTSTSPIGEPPSLPPKRNL